jgi:hypothetical protein
VIPPPLAILTGIADTVVVAGNKGGEEDHDDVVATLGELQALLAGAPTPTGLPLEAKFELE